MSESQQTESRPASKNAGKLCAGKTTDIRNVWDALRSEAARLVTEETSLRHLVDDVILSRADAGNALGARLARRLAREDMPRAAMEPLLTGVFEEHPHIVHSAMRDLVAMYERDPACFSILEPLLFFKGFLALTTHRVSHQLWLDGRRWLALYLQSVASEVFAVDIHPAARIGCGILLDHATSFVVGETAIIEDDVSILHEVTLGGTGKEKGDRHPKVRRGVLIGVGATILGNIEIGQGAKIGAGSLVLKNIPPHCTAVGVPAEVVKGLRTGQAGLEMDHTIDVFHGDGI